MQTIKTELGRFLDSADHGRDVVILTFVVVVIAAISWLTFDVVVHHGLTSAFLDALRSLLAFVGLGGPAKSLVDRMNPTTPPSSDAGPQS